MINTSRILLILTFFLYTIISSIIYMIINKKIDDWYEESVERKMQTFGKVILEHLNSIKNGEDIPIEEILKVSKSLKNKIYEEVLNKSIILFNSQGENRLITRKYMMNFNSYILKTIKKQGSTNNEKKTYVLYLLGEYNIDDEYINDFLINAIESKSLYIRFNSFSSIAQIGNVKYFEKALAVIADTEGYLNDKLLIDIIDKFSGDMDELNDMLSDNLDEFNEKIQIIVIKHFSNYKDENMAFRLLKKLKDYETSKEVKITIIKYFNEVHYSEAKKTLLNILDDLDWECRALSAKTLSNYYGKDTVDKLIYSITDSNWYVRLNSASSLLEFNLDDLIIETILNKGDKYAGDIIYYAMFIKNKICYEEYLEKVSKDVREQHVRKYS